MAPFSFVNLVEARSVGPLRGGDSQADCIRKLGTPEGVGGTSRKQRKPSVFKYGDLQLLFERPEMALYAAVIDVSDAGVLFRDGEDHVSNLFESVFQSSSVSDFEAWASENRISFSTFESAFGNGFEIDPAFRLYLADNGNEISKMEIGLLR